jgi:hypothetical protein
MSLSNWNAISFFQNLVAKNKLAVTENFTFCKVSGLEGFEEALEHAQTATAFVCVSDIADGYTELNNTPRTRRIKTVFLAMRHAVDDMDARTECMETMRELFRQFMSVLTREAVKLSQDYIYLDPRIAFTEIDRYFFSGCACAYFQIAVDIFTDLQFRSSEWADGFNPDKKPSEIWLTDFSTRLKTIKAICQTTGISVTEATELVDGVPSIILSNTTIEKFNEIKPIFDEINATIEFK